jgi:hypothetical protein
MKFHEEKHCRYLYIVSNLLLNSIRGSVPRQDRQSVATLLGLETNTIALRMETAVFVETFYNVKYSTLYIT